MFTAEDRAAGVPERELGQAATEGRAPDERWHLRKDGSRFWASGMVTAARNETGKIRGFVKIMRDQTDRKTLEMRMQNALSAAEDLRVTAESANRAKDEFIATVSHELRTPLNTIRLWSRMLASGKVQLEEAHEGVLMIERAAVAQQQLIDDLLDVSRMASGKFRLSLRDTQLSKAIEEAVESVRPVAEARKVALESILSADVGVVRADPDRLQQVVLNLLTNAVKFTPSGGIVRVTLSQHLADGIEIVVQDSGIGIRPEFIPHVFDRFRQADSSTTRQHSGLGLGLSIARQLVELHGGTISASSEGEGRGASFTVRLPHLERSAQPLQSDRNEPFVETKGLFGIDILLVEDDAGTRQATSILLRQQGGHVREADSAPAARDALRIRHPQLLVADVGLAGEDGYMLIREVRRWEQERKLTPVCAVAVTAFASAEDRKKAMAAGFDDHIPKPLNPERFIATLVRLMHAG
jgi:signal transduction histidine kinase/CheY-like chemotaxis protein